MAMTMSEHTKAVETPLDVSTRSGDDIHAEEQNAFDTYEAAHHFTQEHYQEVEPKTVLLANQHMATTTEPMRQLLKPAAAEMIGSALFVFVGCGSGMTTTQYTFTGSITIGVALTFGMTIFVLAFAIGHISGGHLNCAVTFALCILRRITVTRCVVYFFAQLIGGLIGIGCLMIITPTMWYGNCFAANAIQPNLTRGAAFIAESILTMILMLTVMAATDSNKSNQIMVPFAIGMAVFICHMIGLPITGCSINPTRTFASSVAAYGVPGCTQAFKDQWIFWIGPLFGASVGAMIYEYCFYEGGQKVDRLIDQYILRK